MEEEGGGGEWRGKVDGELPVSFSKGGGTRWSGRMKGESREGAARRTSERVAEQGEGDGKY